VLAIILLSIGTIETLSRNFSICYRQVCLTKIIEMMLWWYYLHWKQHYVDEDPGFADYICDVYYGKETNYIFIVIKIRNIFE
jgi:hypothetical protein